MVGYYLKWLTQLGGFAAHPLAFIVAVAYVACWLFFDTKSFDWQASVTVATWFMTLFIQRAEHRETQAIHAKLDELLRVSPRARSEIAHIDEKEPEAIEQHRAAERDSD